MTTIATQITARTASPHTQTDKNVRSAAKRKAVKGSMTLPPPSSGKVGTVNFAETKTRCDAGAKRLPTTSPLFMGGATFDHRRFTPDPSGYAHTDRVTSALPFRSDIRNNVDGCGHDPADLSPDRLRGKRVLDMGSGAGAFVGQLRDAGVDAVGVDRDQGGPNITCCDMRQTPFKDESFDVIVSTQSVFSYNTLAEVKQEALLEAWRLLARNGTLHLAPVNVFRLERDVLPAVPGMKLTKVHYMNGGEDGGLGVTLTKTNADVSAEMVATGPNPGPYALAKRFPELASYFSDTYETIRSIYHRGAVSPEERQQLLKVISLADYMTVNLIHRELVNLLPESPARQELMAAIEAWQPMTP